VFNIEEDLCPGVYVLAKIVGVYVRGGLCPTIEWLNHFVIAVPVLQYLDALDNAAVYVNNCVTTVLV